MKRGSVLLEVLVAVAILVGAGSAIMAASDRGERLLRRSRDTAQAADLARSILSAVEAGLVTPQNAPASVRSGRAGAAWLALDPDNNLPETPTGEGRWKVEVESEPTEWTGLAKLTVHVFDTRPGRDAAAEASTPAFSLTQIVRLAPEGSDSAGDAAVKGPLSKPGGKTAPVRTPGRDRKGGA